MPSRFCPICRYMKIVRKDLRTCGSPECVAMWRILSPTQKAQAIEEAAQFDATPTNLSNLRDQLTQSSPSSDAPQRGPKSSAERDDEALKKLFGDDAPGLSKPKIDTENDN